MKRWLLAILMALNQGINALSGGNPDETVSSRAGQAREQGSRVGAGLCEVFDWLDPRDGDSPQGDHCDIAIENHRRSLRESLNAISNKTSP
jgi:hypothetical protein